MQFALYPSSAVKMSSSKYFTRKGKRKRATSTPMLSRFKRRRIATDDQRFRSRVPLIRGPTFGFPDKLQTRLRYCDTLALTGAVGVIGDNVFRANSLFDPDLTNPGHQPMWFDQLCSANGPYQRYRVLGSKITVRFAVENAPSLAALNLGPISVGIMKDSNSTLLVSNESGLRESSGCNWKILQDKSGGNNVMTVTNTFSPNRDLGFDIGDDTIEAAYNANPSQSYFWHVWKVDVTGTSTVAAFIEIEFLAEFFQRTEVVQS